MWVNPWSRVGRPCCWQALTLATLTNAVANTYIRALDWGTSEWSATDILQAQAVADKLGLVSPVVEQPEFSLLRRDRVEREYSVVFGSQRGYGGALAMRALCPLGKCYIAFVCAYVCVRGCAQSLESLTVQNSTHYSHNVLCTRPWYPDGEIQRRHPGELTLHRF
jgi:hypothetical protein